MLGEGLSQGKRNGTRIKGRIEVEESEEHDVLSLLKTGGVDVDWVSVT